MGFGEPYPWVYVDGAFVAADEARVSILANTLQYGTGTFEGIRACWNAGHEELYLLDADAHYARLVRSAHILGLDLPSPVETLVESTAELLRRNDVRTDAYIRPVYFLAEELLFVRMHDIAPRLAIAATPIPGEYIASAGVRCMVASWRRSPDVVLPSRAKIIGSYVGPALAKTEAVRHGFDEAILLTLDGHVAEATTSNIVIRQGDAWSTPPATDDILDGITLRQVSTLIEEDFGTSVTRRRIHRSELYTADEVLLCGTAAFIAPVVEVDGRRIGAGEPGERTVALQGELRAIARRETDRHPEWTTPVYATKEAT